MLDASGLAVDLAQVIRKAMDSVDQELAAGNVADGVDLRGLEVLNSPAGGGEQPIEISRASCSEPMRPLGKSGDGSTEASCPTTPWLLTRAPTK